MLESMTGFAAIEHNQDGVAFSLSLRSVNSRFLEFRIRLPKAFSSLEQEIEKTLRNEINRGRLDFDIQILPESQNLTHIRANTEKAAAIFDGISEIAQALKIPGEVQLRDVLDIGGSELFDLIEDKGTNQTWHEHILRASHDAARKLKETRQEEGVALSTELKRNIEKIADHVQSIEGKIGQVRAQMQGKLEQRLHEITESQNSDVSSDRLEQELLILLERADIREELVRLKAHVDAFEKTRTGSDQTRGKRLDFLLQEILREVNTLGSKIPDAQIRNQVVDMKVLVEQLRQQVANVA